MIIAAYRDRLTQFVESTELMGWHLKLYSITADEKVISKATIESAVQYAKLHVDWPATQPGFGFITLHRGEELVWLLVDLWVDDILRHFLFCAPLNHPTQFRAGPTDGSMACVWELEVLNHERNAWVNHVMTHPQQPNYAAYMQDHLQIRPEQ